MKTIAAAKFKAHGLALMDDVHKNREPIVITKRGKPVAKLVPAGNDDREFLGRLEGIIRIVGDIESPLEPPEAWDALKWSCLILTCWFGRSAIRSGFRARQGGGLAVSAITLWELGLLVNRGRIQIHGTVESSIRQLLEDVTIRPITDEIAALAVQFPDDYRRDPADRLIGATARAEGLTLINSDRA
jgi:prevent-host-death family protein